MVPDSHGQVRAMSPFLSGIAQLPDLPSQYVDVVIRNQKLNDLPLTNGDIAQVRERHR